MSSLDQPREMIDVRDIDRAELLAALYNATRPVGRGAMHDLCRDMTVAEARVALEEQRQQQRGLGRLGIIAYFDYLYGRPIKLDVEQDALDFYNYDDDAGAGTGKRVVEALRQRKSR